MATPKHLHSPSVSQGRRYWVVSPNVNNDTHANDWRQLSLREHAAFMGYRLDRPIGRRFAKTIVEGDVILIARRYEGEPEFVAYGVVVGKAKRRARHSIPWGGSFRSLRRLKPFRTNRPPSSVPLQDALQHTMSLVQLHPERSAPHRQLCDWLERQLRKTDRKVVRKALVESGAGENDRNLTVSSATFPEPGQPEFNMQTKNKIIRAQRRESELLQDYKDWLYRRGRHLELRRFGKLVCDAYEPKSRTLIEAKSSSRREYIRMGVGQLLDYAFQARKTFRCRNLALLLPSRPDSASLKWLEPLNINVVWQNGNVFADNAGGRFCDWCR